MRNRSELARLAETLRGLPVLGCFEGSPAAIAGVRYGDVLLAIDGKPTPTWEDYVEAREANATASFVARIFRDGAVFDVVVGPPDGRRATLDERLEELAELRIATSSALGTGREPFN